MTKQVRTILMLIVGLAIMGLAGCDHYNCASGANFGSSTCNPSTGTGGGAASAFVFVTDTTGTIDGYTLNQTAGTLAPTTGYIAPTGLPSGGLNASLGMVVANQKGASAPFLYALYPSGIYGFSVGSTGDLTPLTPVSLNSATAIPQTTYFQYVMVANPQGTLLFIAEPLAGTILVYTIQSTGALVLAQTVSTSGVILPQNLGMDGLGSYLFVSDYSTDHAGSFIAEYGVANTGALTLIQTYTTGAPLWQMQGDPSGQYLIGVSGATDAIPPGQDNDNVFVYSIAPASAATPGLLTALAPFPTNPAYSPFSMAVQPVAGTNGPLIYTFSINDAGTADNPIEGFQLAPSTGALTSVTVSGAGLALSGGFDPGGSYLFIYQEQSITAYQVSTDGGLTSGFGFSTGLNTGGYWAAVDVP
jgi:lactonase family protein with 7-bladed beta-propeller